MPSRMIPYNADIMKTKCTLDRCGVVNRRCVGTVAGGGITPPHLGRVHAAGYRWDKVNRVLIKEEESNEDRNG